MSRAKPLEVKVCGMRAASNIGRVALLLPNYLGFIFVPDSPRYVSDSISKEVLDFLPQVVSTVGVFRDQPIDFIVAKVRRLGLHVVQLHGQEDREFVRNIRLAAPSVEIWKAIGISSREDVVALDHDFGGVDRFLLDSGTGGTGHTFNWRFLVEYRAPIPCIVAGGIGNTNIGALLDIAQRVEGLVGIDVNSCVESEPGMKDIKKVEDILDKVRSRS